MTTILVIDDSKFSRNRILSVLKNAEFQAIEASNGVEGLAALEQHKPDGILLDLLMPVMDGPAFLKELRERGHQLPVVVLTADIQESSRSLCDNYKVSHFLNKPVKEEELRQCMAQLFPRNLGNNPCT